MIVRKPENCEGNKIEYHGEVVSRTRGKKAGDRKLERKIQRKGFCGDRQWETTYNKPSFENNYKSLYREKEQSISQYQFVLENSNHHKAMCIDILNLHRGDNTEEGVYGNVEANISSDLMKPYLNQTNMEFITLIHTRELIEIYNVGTIIIGRGAEGNFVVVI